MPPINPAINESRVGALTFLVEEILSSGGSCNMTTREKILTSERGSDSWRTRIVSDIIIIIIIKVVVIIIMTYSLSREVHGLFKNEFLIEGNLVLSLSVHTIVSFP